MTTVRFGLSTTFPCGYLEQEHEQLLVYIDEHPLSPFMYSALQDQGFRRSDNQVYKPHCPNCNACQSIRVSPYKFAMSKSQKRIFNKGKHFQINVTSKPKPEYYDMFEQYVNTKHENGVMYPATPDQLESFTNCEWMTQLFIELYDGHKLIAVAITDVTPDSLSAVYTFYDIHYAKYSLGTLMILHQINLVQELEKSWLYLGYYISNCDKMNYKTKFTPYQIRKSSIWAEIDD